MMKLTYKGRSRVNLLIIIISIIKILRHLSVQPGGSLLQIFLQSRQGDRWVQQGYRWHLVMNILSKCYRTQSVLSPESSYKSISTRISLSGQFLTLYQLTSWSQNSKVSRCKPAADPCQTRAFKGVLGSAAGLIRWTYRRKSKEISCRVTCHSHWAKCESTWPRKSSLSKEEIIAFEHSLSNVKRRCHL